MGTMAVASQWATGSSGSLSYLINHVFLPPQLPQEDDSDLSCDQALLESIIPVLDEFESKVAAHDKDRVRLVKDSLMLVKNLINENGHIDGEKLYEAFGCLANSRDGTMLPVYLKAQNAGLIITKLPDRMLFEPFELTPTNEAAMSTSGRLVRHFPGMCVAVDRDQFCDADLQDVLASTMSTMSFQEAASMMPLITKASKKVPEIRDTNHPGLVTELLISMLAPYCHSDSHDGHQRVTKNTREEVLWHNCKLPWRRSPFWLLIRVVLQLRFDCLDPGAKAKGEQEQGQEHGHSLYKLFMVYHHAQVLDATLATMLNVEPDMVFFMSAKLSRRIRKMDLSGGEPGIEFARHVLETTDRVLQKEWSEAQRKDTHHVDLDLLPSLSFQSETFLSLPHLKGVLAGTTDKADGRMAGTELSPWDVLATFPPTDLPRLSSISGSSVSLPQNMQYNLFGLEEWVDRHLETWIGVHGHDLDACPQLYNVMKTYVETAVPMYSARPDAFSIMLLTVLELWVACDRSCVQRIPLLLDYMPPAIPQKQLEALVLTQKRHMARLLRVEQYLQTRRQNAAVADSILSSFAAPSSFAVRYYDESAEHQELHRQIKADASEARRQKQCEFAQKKKEYQSLINLHKTATCDYYDAVDEWGDIYQKHWSLCHKCRIKAQADGICIQVHEWPLPDGSLAQKNVVFELHAPQEFSAWRDAGVFLVVEVLRSTHRPMETPAAHFRLASYGGLCEYFRGSTSPGWRVGLLSGVKPHINTHRNVSDIAYASEATVCVNNGLRLRYYDADHDCFIDGVCHSDHVLTSCTYKLPRTASALQPFLQRTFDSSSDATANQVIASQDSCPENMTLAEYRGLASLAVGYRLPWLGLLVQLASPQVDWKKPETVLCVLQVIYQAGPAEGNDVLRACHSRLANLIFAVSLLSAVDEAVARIEENWESLHALGALACIACRALSLAPNTDLANTALAILDRVCRIAIRWVHLLQENYDSTPSEAHRQLFVTKIRQIATICAATFAVDDEHLETVLSDPERASLFIQCSILICDNSLGLSDAGARSTSTSTLDSHMHHRWMLVAYRACPILRAKILDAQSPSLCLDNAVHGAWPSFRPRTAWISHSARQSHWLTTSSGMSRVDYNLVTGRLLVDGRPLTRLPDVYGNRTEYKTLFGRLVFRVFPSSDPGFQFSLRHRHEGHTIQLGLGGVDGQDLLVKAKREEANDGHVYHFVPCRVFRGRLPDAFTSDYVHWYDASRGVVEFRDKRRPWQSDDRTTWVLRPAADRDNNDAWQLSDMHGKRLVCPHGTTGVAMGAVFAPLQTRLQMNLLLPPDTKTDTLEIHLPNLQLEFHLEQGTTSIRSKQSRGMQVDSDQALGTLVGLKNKLVLRNPSNGERSVLVPAGNIEFGRGGGGGGGEERHMNVTIVRPPAVASAYTFKVNTTLERLETNGSLESRLYLCYLHAVTSFCLPDPLTKFTGTEQALTILNSAAVWSHDVFSRASMDLLGCIAALSHRRVYYPRNLQVMETVLWDRRLSALAQHPRLRELVQALLAQDAENRFYYPDSKVEPPRLEECDPYLVRRAAARMARARTHGCGADADADGSVSDKTYQSRDAGQSSCRASKAMDASLMVWNKESSLQRHLPKSQNGISDILWSTFKMASKVLGHRQPSGTANNSANIPTSLAYDSCWLEKQEDHWGQYWCWLHRQAKKHPGASRHHLSIWLATMAFATEDNVINNCLIQQAAAAALFVVDSVRAIDLPAPDAESFQLSLGCRLDDQGLRQLIKCYEFDKSAESKLPTKPHETKRAAHGRKFGLWSQAKDSAVTSLVRHLSSQWPSPNPRPPAQPTIVALGKYLDVSNTMKVVVPYFRLRYDNLQFKQYLETIDSVLRRTPVRPLASTTPTVAPPNAPATWAPCSLDPRTVFSASTAPREIPPSSRGRLVLPDMGSGNGIDTDPESNASLPADRKQLQDLVGALKKTATSQYEAGYAEGLQKSLDTLSLHQASADAIGVRYRLDDLGQRLQEHLAFATARVSEIFSSIETSIQDNMAWSASLATRLHHGPRISATLLLQQLRHDQWSTLPEAWRAWVLSYGLAITEMQRVRRLVRAQHDQNTGDFVRELRNAGHSNWNPYDKPEDLLLEIESNILIREVQQDIATTMSNPPDGRNAVMQLNMGEGKSSVIVPLVVMATADGLRLVRVVVAKSQSRQMFHMLVSKLGGLLNRRIFRLPFSRALRLTAVQVNTIRSQCIRCMELRGIMLALPEQLLSFQEMGIESMLAGNKREAIGRALIDIQHLFNRQSRDIVDESDENFSVKFELIYTIGSQGPIDFCPDRWTVIQRVLDLVRDHAFSVRDELPLSIEIHEHGHKHGHKQHGGHGGGGARGFPRIRLLNADAAKRLLTDKVARDICQKGLPGFPVARQSPAQRDAVFTYITQADLGADEIEQVEAGPFWTDATKNHLLLLRGLFAMGILSFAFGQKRWRVNYGLDDSRSPPTKLAVPFRAKDQPTARSEYSHPDVIILLTCSCYYYKGLSDDEMFAAFAMLVDSEDQADDEYQAWVNAADNLPPAFRSLLGINLEDTIQCQTQVFPPLRYAKPVIDYFLCTVVFPKHMREFPKKLSASGWDLASIKQHPTTGFSGTADAKHVLPHDITHLDLPDQRHTDALVLDYLLRPENNIVSLPAHQGPSGSSENDINNSSSSSSVADDLLKLVVGQGDARLRVILDVGAQVLELTNRQVAETWLAMEMQRQQQHLHHDGAKVEAAVYFDDNEEVLVLDYKGNSEPLRVSQYMDQLDLCVVFLDEAHTRGTDLPLPANYRAAVTLGAKLTKDRLVQACMRLRKLGNGQSVLFCVPHEIETKIHESRNNSPSPSNKDDSPVPITIKDVLLWAIGETHADLRKSMPLWAVQGIRYERQRKIWDAAIAEGNTDSIVMTQARAKALLEDEAMTLEQRYRPRLTLDARGGVQVLGGMIPEEEKEEKESDRLQAIRQRCSQVSHINMNESTLHEEQERELSPEIEEERQLERPPPATPAKHSIHPDVRHFVATGTLPSLVTSTAFIPAFDAAQNTSAARHLDTNMFPADILVTRDFARTIVAASWAWDESLDAFQRPVQWVLSSQPGWKAVVVISPFEAQTLLPEIECSSAVALHLFRPGRDSLGLYTIASKSTLDSLSDDLSAGSLPPLRQVVLLNLFAGELYLESLDEYRVLCDVLRLSWKKANDHVTIAADGFILDETGDANARAVIASSTFSASPVQFLRVFLSKIRRDGQSINKTHLGKLLDGTLLDEQVGLKTYRGD